MLAHSGLHATLWLLFETNNTPQFWMESLKSCVAYNVCYWTWMRMFYFKWSTFWRLHYIQFFFSSRSDAESSLFVGLGHQRLIIPRATNILLLYVHTLLLLSSNLGLATEADRHYLATEADRHFVYAEILTRYHQFSHVTSTSAENTKIHAHPLLPD